MYEPRPGGRGMNSPRAVAKEEKNVQGLKEHLRSKQQGWRCFLLFILLEAGARMADWEPAHAQIATGKMFIPTYLPRGIGEQWQQPPKAHDLFTNFYWQRHQHTKPHFRFSNSMRNDTLTFSHHTGKLWCPRIFFFGTRFASVKSLSRAQCFPQFTLQ